MYALRERRVHVTQEDFEMAVAKVHITECSILCPNLSSPLVSSHKYLTSKLTPT